MDVGKNHLFKQQKQQAGNIENELKLSGKENNNEKAIPFPIDVTEFSR